MTSPPLQLLAPLTATMMSLPVLGETQNATVLPGCPSEYPGCPSEYPGSLRVVSALPSSGWGAARGYPGVARGYPGVEGGIFTPGLTVPARAEPTSFDSTRSELSLSHTEPPEGSFDLVKEGSFGSPSGWSVFQGQRCLLLGHK